VRRPLIWIAGALVGVVLVLLVTGAVGNRDDRGESVTAGQWAQNVCGAVGVWRGELKSIVEDIRTPSAVALSGEEPQSETPQGRTGLLRAGLDRGLESADILVEAIDNAGVPDTPQGKEASQQVSDWANSTQDSLEKAQDSLNEESDTLEGSLDQVAGAARALRSARTSGLQTIASVASLDPALAAALRESSTCKQLREETN
jgi:hypothetical protein